MMCRGRFERRQLMMRAQESAARKGDVLIWAIETCVGEVFCEELYT